MKNKEIEQRLHNIETAFMAYVSLTDCMLPAAVKCDVNNMLNQLMVANQNNTAFEVTHFKSEVDIENE